MNYSRKLRDARWQKLRLEVMERDGWKCQEDSCCSPDNTMLHVHHKQYLPNREPWEYPLENLITYCEACHEKQHAKLSHNVKLIEGVFYRWSELPSLLGFEPHGYLSQDEAGVVRCGCFRLDCNPDAPSIVLPGKKASIAAQARIFAGQKSFVPVFVKGQDFGWEYCGSYRVEAVTINEVEIGIQEERVPNRKGTISMVLFLEKGR